MHGTLKARLPLKDKISLGIAGYIPRNPLFNSEETLQGKGDFRLGARLGYF